MAQIQDSRRNLIDLELTRLLMEATPLNGGLVLVVASHTHTFSKDVHTGNASHILVSNPMKSGKVIHYAGNPATGQFNLDLNGDTIPAVQGSLDKSRTEWTYMNYMRDGARILRGKEIIKTPYEKPVRLHETDLLLLGHFDKCPEFTLEFKKIYRS